MTPAATLGTFSDFRPVKSRSVVQLIIEVPIERADEALYALGGVPIPGREGWVVITRVDPAKIESAARAAAPTSQRDDKPPASFTTKAGIACAEPLFWRWLREVGLADVHDAQEAAVFVRGHCHVKSRSELATNIDAAARFDPLWRRYQEYKNGGLYALEAAQ